MTYPRLSLRRPYLGRTGLRILATGLLGLGLLAAPATAGQGAHADPPGPAPVDDLRRQAERLGSRLDALQVTLERAGEAYEAATAELGAAAEAEVAARQQLDQAHEDADRTAARATRRVRALYISGGDGVLAAQMLGTVLDGRDVGDVLERAQAVQGIVQDDAARSGSSVASDDRARRAAASAAAESARQVQARAAADRAYTDVQAALGAQQRLLRQSDARVVRLEADERAAADRVALAAATGSATAAGIRDVVGAAPTSTAAAAVAAARSVLGRPYLWGATGPDSFDCSGLTSWAYRRAGLTIPRTSRQQAAGLAEVSLSALLPGDLVLYADGTTVSSVHHVGMYLGGGLMVHAPHTGDVVRIAPVTGRGLYAAVRPAA